MYLENNNAISFLESILARFPYSEKDKNKITVYTSEDEEYQALKNGVGLRIIEEPVFIKLKNKDSTDFLHRISSNSVNDMKPFQQRSTLFLNEKGRFIARANLLMLDGEVWLLSNEDPNARLFSWLNKYIIMEDIKTENCTGKFSLLEMIGYQAESFISLMIGDEINKISESDLRRFDVDGFTFYLFIVNENGNKIIRILLDSIKLIPMIDYLYSIKSVFDLALVGESAYKHFRIKNMIPAFPYEINAETNPHEVNLINEVNFKKGCYIGQEVIARLDTYDKVQRKLSRLILAHNSIGNASTIFDSEGNEAGIITSIQKHKNNESINALGLIHKKYFSTDNGLYILDDAARIPVKVVDKEQ